MPLVAKETQTERKLPPAGTHTARCFSIIDLGSHKNKFGNTARRVRVTWELPEETSTFREGGVEEPFIISKEYTVSLHEKSNLRKDLQSWLGAPFTPEGLKGFDLFQMLGKACFISIIHDTSDSSGKEYANIASISPLAKGMKCAEPFNDPVTYAIEEGSNTTFLALPTWLQEKITASEELKNDEETADDLETQPKEGDPDW